MLYLSIDLETTGLNPKQDQILQFAAVLEDTCNIKPIEDLDYFCCFVEHDRIEGNAYALQMNDWILRILAGVTPTNYPVYNHKLWYLHCVEWLLNITHKHDTSRITPAGKNFGSFDLQFLPDQIKKFLDFRSLDPGSLCVDFMDDQPDYKVPGLPKLKKELGIEGDVSHDALDDARDVIKVFRAATNNYTKHIYTR